MSTFVCVQSNKEEMSKSVNVSFWNTIYVQPIAYQAGCSGPFSVMVRFLSNAQTYNLEK
jgi:hypothetical protein